MGHIVRKLVPVYEDGRGKIFDVLDGESIAHVGFVTSRAGAIRGNHYHVQETQYTLVVKGKVKWITKDVRDSQSPVTVVLEPGDLAIDAPHMAHAMIAL